MHAEQAAMTDLKEIMAIYEYARGFMKTQGNATQWGDNYPEESIIREDIEKKRLYVFRSEGKEIQGVFMFMTEEEPNYARIDGAWKNDKPYGTIHRVAAAPGATGIFDCCVAFCRKKIGNLRIDTHRDNKVMRYVIQRSGFEECGIVRVEDGTERIAYQYEE